MTFVERALDVMDAVAGRLVSEAWLGRRRGRHEGAQPLPESSVGEDRRPDEAMSRCRCRCEGRDYYAVTTIYPDDSIRHQYGVRPHS